MQVISKFTASTVFIVVLLSVLFSTLFICNYYDKISTVKSEETKYLSEYLDHTMHFVREGISEFEADRPLD